MNRGILALVAAALALLIVLPLITPSRESPPAEAPPSPTAPAPPPIPSVTEAPPAISAQQLVGTTWEAVATDMPEFDDDSQLHFRYAFGPAGQVRLSFTRPDIEEASPDGRVLFEMLLPDALGQYEVEGAEIRVVADIHGNTRHDRIDIRGHDLFYHGARMVQVDPAGRH